MSESMSSDDAPLNVNMSHQSEPSTPSSTSMLVSSLTATTAESSSPHAPESSQSSIGSPSSTAPAAAALATSIVAQDATSQQSSKYRSSDIVHLRIEAPSSSDANALVGPSASSSSGSLIGVSAVASSSVDGLIVASASNTGVEVEEETVGCYVDAPDGGHYATYGYYEEEGNPGFTATASTAIASSTFASTATLNAINHHQSITSTASASSLFTSTSRMEKEPIIENKEMMIILPESAAQHPHIPYALPTSSNANITTSRDKVVTSTTYATGPAATNTSTASSFHPAPYAGGLAIASVSSSRSSTFLPAPYASASSTATNTNLSVPHSTAASSASHTNITPHASASAASSLSSNAPEYHHPSIGRLLNPLVSIQSQAASQHPHLSNALAQYRYLRATNLSSSLSQHRLLSSSGTTLVPANSSSSTTSLFPANHSSSLPCLSTVNSEDSSPSRGKNGMQPSHSVQSPTPPSVNRDNYVISIPPMTTTAHSSSSAPPMIGFNPGFSSGGVNVGGANIVGAIGGAGGVPYNSYTNNLSPAVIMNMNQVGAPRYYQPPHLNQHPYHQQAFTPPGNPGSYGIPPRFGAPLLPSGLHTPYTQQQQQYLQHQLMQQQQQQQPLMQQPIQYSQQTPPTGSHQRDASPQKSQPKQKQNKPRRQSSSSSVGPSSSSTEIQGNSFSISAQGITYGQNPDPHPNTAPAVPPGNPGFVQGFFGPSQVLQAQSASAPSSAAPPSSSSSSSNRVEYLYLPLQCLTDLSAFESSSSDQVVSEVVVESAAGAAAAASADHLVDAVSAAAVSDNLQAIGAIGGQTHVVGANPLAAGSMAAAGDHAGVTAKRSYSRGSIKDTAPAAAAGPTFQGPSPDASTPIGRFFQQFEHSSLVTDRAPSSTELACASALTSMSTSGGGGVRHSASFTVPAPGVPLPALNETHHGVPRSASSTGTTTAGASYSPWSDNSGVAVVKASRSFIEGSGQGVGAAGDGASGATTAGGKCATNSVPPKQEPIDPDMIRQHPDTAAASTTASLNDDLGSPLDDVVNSTTKSPKRKKRPLTAYSLWVKENKDFFNDESRGLGIGQRSRIWSEAWRNLSDEEKRPYHEEAKRQKEQFDRLPATQQPVVKVEGAGGGGSGRGRGRGARGGGGRGGGGSNRGRKRKKNEESFEEPSSFGGNIAQDHHPLSPSRASSSAVTASSTSSTTALIPQQTPTMQPGAAATVASFVATPQMPTALFVPSSVFSPQEPNLPAPPQNPAPPSIYPSSVSAPPSSIYPSSPSAPSYAPFSSPSTRLPHPNFSPAPSSFSSSSSPGPSSSLVASPALHNIGALLGGGVLSSSSLLEQKKLTMHKIGLLQRALREEQLALAKIEDDLRQLRESPAPASLVSASMSQPLLPGTTQLAVVSPTQISSMAAAKEGDSLKDGLGERAV